ncbi:unnamed protein product [Hermetia illucens]|uniref:DNA-directed RNA polymerase II subunit GRINL1A n=1 Tax=Hermetia illucens TaxID=343691 RepID=A0A7R8Z1J1_HERIL|nr:uncharacterized protein LOC119658908 [Hermetia illucens]CAD7093589.1 unnamed protein product [Hermetia illucens]
MIPRPKLTRIPGELPTSKADTYTQDLTKLTRPQLLELRDRQMKLLENKQRISKLPDKGARIQNFYDKILKELAQRDDVQKAAELFSDLNIASTGQEKLTTLEWTGKLDREDRGEAILDSDDDEETDPLKIIAQGYTADKIVKYVKPERSLITEQDLKEIESFEREKHNGSVCSEASSTHSIELEPHALYLIEKTVDHPLSTEKFLPHKTTKSNVHDPEKEKLRKRGKYWENTAATPPPIMHSGTKMLSLQESIEVQADYEQRLKRVQEEQAKERLAAKLAQGREHNLVLPDEAIRKLNQFFGVYREDNGSDSDLESVHELHIASDDEVVDEDEDRGHVTYTVYT